MHNDPRRGPRRVFNKAMDRLEAAIIATFPIGATCFYDHNRPPPQCCEVLAHGYKAERIKVRNINTGREFWLHETRLRTEP